MMVKRLIYFLFLMSAVTTMLAHDVIPHHHHEENVCFDHYSCEPDSGEEEHDSKQNSQSGENCCPLATKLVFTHSSHEIITPVRSNQHQHFHHNAIVESYKTISSAPFILLPFRQHPPFNSTYKSLAYLSHSLRAPPVV